MRDGTIRTKAWAAVAVAAALVATAIGPVGAANTAGERLVDHDDNPRTAPVRQFAGADRYATAALLAEAAIAGGADTSTVLIASGETQIDAVAAAGLAGALQAPILLSRTGTLPGVTARFINEHSPSRVIILGGPAAVSDDVARRIENLPADPEVVRIAGADRYSTAAAIADEIGGGTDEWCGNAGATAVLTAGTAIAEAVAAGPLVYAHAAPLLLTAHNELPEPTAAWITEHDIERVIVVGGTDAVSRAVERDELFELGVGDVRRIGGRDAAQTSVMLARELAAQGCADAFAADNSVYGLVRLTSPSDGVTAAPAFGSWPTDGRPVALLLVADTLPGAVRSFLAGTPRYDTAGAPIHIDLVAVGGPAAVSAEVMLAAVDAAAAAPLLTATISEAEPGDTSFTITFSDDVDPAAVTSRSLVRINGVPRGDLTLTVTRPREVTVTLQSPGELAAGDEITVTGGRKVGITGDARPLQAASYTVPERSTRQGPAPVPQISVSAVEGATKFAVLVSNSILGNGEEISVDEIEIEGPGGTPIAIVGPLEAHHNLLLTHRYAWVATVADPLADGTVIRIANRAVTDESGAYRSGRRDYVVRESGDLRVQRVQVSDAVPTADAVTLIRATTSTLDAQPAVEVRARSDADAGGAASAGWRLDTWYDDTEPDGDILVAVDPRHQVLSVTIGPKVSIQELVWAMAAAPAVADRFDVRVATAATSVARTETITAVGTTAQSTHHAARFAGGRSKVEIRAAFTTAVATLADDGAELLESLLAPLRAEGDTTSCTATGTRWDCFASPSGLPAAADVAMRFVPGTSFVDIWVETADLQRLPKFRDPLSVAPAVAQGWPDDNTNPRHNRLWIPGDAAGETSITDSAWD